ncbi:hypothetical protein MOTE_10580 [Moorella thermoacetica]|uniref:Uncharacterized protein n=1 Tax=Neomoorella thermoacetica TaxID=1525 RepID=A0A1J5NLZ2_NEOTH|nr:hypothetical protein MOTE_10580 [Moorella thermoacetica]
MAALFSRILAVVRKTFAAVVYLALAAGFTLGLIRVLSAVPPDVAVPASREKVFFWTMCAAAGFLAAAFVFFPFGRKIVSTNASGSSRTADFHECLSRLSALETELHEAPPEAADAVMGAIFIERERLDFILHEIRVAARRKVKD